MFPASPYFRQTFLLSGGLPFFGANLTGHAADLEGWPFHLREDEHAFTELY